MVCFFLSWFFCRRLQAKEKMKDVNDEREEGKEEEEQAIEALTGASRKVLIYNLETAM